jgi:DNA-binding MarR family transcriptional regulator
VTRSLSDELVADHGITIEQYEILSRLARTPDGRMRQADISERSGCAQDILTRSLPLTLANLVMPLTPDKT